ncbi:MAG: hypothetical protein MR431_07730 [Clostridia bacterium]|nr:hypothetical protein [Clostridia bacterium]
MLDDTATLGQNFLSNIWRFFGITVPGFSFTLGQMWLGIALCVISIYLARMLFGMGGGVSSRTSNPKISPARKDDEY